MFLLSFFVFTITINAPADQSIIPAVVNATANGDTVLNQPNTCTENKIARGINNV